MIKKGIALLVGLLLLCSFAVAETADYTGEWYLVSIETNGAAMNPADLGMEMTMILNADGTGTVVMTGEDDKPATWTIADGVITVTAEEEPLGFTLTEDGTLVAESYGSVMTFGREAPGQGFVPAAEVAAEDLAAFDGTWNITMVNAYGMVLPFSAMAQMGLTDGAVVIENGSVTAFGAEAAETGTLTDGMLVITSPVEGSFGKTIRLLEDGTLSMEYMEMYFYCEKVVME